MKTSTEEWIAGARPRSLTSAISPVAVGSASAAALDSFRPGHALLALGVAVSLQVAVNYANDYSDGVRGTDANRVGPERLVASGRARPSAVRAAAMTAFAVGSCFGLALALVSGQWWLLGVGAAAVAAAWTYTGSARPYGYRGWGETSVFVFFGMVATIGTMRAQAPSIPWWAWFAAVGVGLHAVAMLLVNNIRDVDSDRGAGKRTLAVRVGERDARLLFAASVWLPIVAAIVVALSRPWALLTLVLLLPTMLISIVVVGGTRGRALAVVFAAEAALGLAYGLVLAAGIVIG